MYCLKISELTGFGGPLFEVVQMTHSEDKVRGKPRSRWRERVSIGSRVGRPEKTRSSYALAEICDHLFGKLRSDQLMGPSQR